MSDESQTDPPVPGQKLSKSASPPRMKPPFPGPRPLPRQDVCSYIAMPRNIDCPGTTQGSGAPACIRSASTDLVGG